MKQLYFSVLFLLSAAVLSGQTVVFDSNNGDYLAYAASSGVLGTEDYIMDLSSFGGTAGTATVTEITFVGGITGSTDGGGGVMDLIFYDAENNFVNSAAFSFSMEGPFTYNLTIAGLEIPSAGFVQAFIDDSRAENTGRSVIGQWFLSTIPSGPPVGDSPLDPFGNGTDINGNELAFGMSITATSVVLPVEFTAVGVAAVKNGLEVTWTTASEEDNRGFEVERSEDGIHFASVGFVNALGRSGDGGSYTFGDETVLKNTDYFYRIRQVDFDGSSSLSEVVTGAWNDNRFTVGQIFPNPATAAAALAVHLENAQLTTVGVYDASGRQVSFQSFNLEAGNHRLNIDVAKLPAGIYITKVISAGEQMTRRLIVR